MPVDAASRSATLRGLAFRGFRMSLRQSAQGPLPKRLHDNAHRHRHRPLRAHRASVRRKIVPLQSEARHRHDMARRLPACRTSDSARHARPDHRQRDPNLRPNVVGAAPAHHDRLPRRHHIPLALRHGVRLPRRLHRLATATKTDRPEGARLARPGEDILQAAGEERKDCESDDGDRGRVLDQRPTVDVVWTFERIPSAQAVDFDRVLRHGLRVHYAAVFPKLHQSHHSLHAQ